MRHHRGTGSVSFYFLLTIILAGTFFSPSTSGARQGHLIQNPIRNIPAWVRKEFSSHHLDDQYKIIYRLYPYTINGDFNGDGRKDVAIQIQDLSSGKTGIAIFHARKPQALYTPVVILGAGKPVGPAGSDFSWVTIWVKQKSAEVLKKEPRPKRPPDAISLSDREEKTMMIVWDGEHYTARRVKG